MTKSAPPPGGVTRGRTNLIFGWAPKPKKRRMSQPMTVACSSVRGQAALALSERQSLVDPELVVEIERITGVSRHDLRPDLSRIFRQELGLSPWEYLTRYRIRQARQLLRITNDSIADIALQVGFDDKAYFTRVFHRYTGCSPSIYRKRRE